MVSESQDVKNINLNEIDNQKNKKIKYNNMLEKQVVLSK